VKKLHVKIANNWEPVFCHIKGQIVTCKDSPQKALPPHSRWADDDLKYFQNKFANHEFCLLTCLSGGLES